MKMRRLIDRDHPVFMTRPVGRAPMDSYPESDFEDVAAFRAQCETLTAILNAYPAEMRPYTAFLISIWPYRPDEGKMHYVDAVLEAADKLGMGVIWEVAGWNSNYDEQSLGNSASVEQVEEMFQKHESLIGVDIVEQSCMDGLVKYRRNFISDMLKLCAKYGGYVFWKDMGYPLTHHPFTIMGSDEEFLDTVRTYHDHLILIHKNNGMTKHLQASGVAVAYWLTGLCHAWGVNAEAWMQYESAHAALFAPPETWRLLDFAEEPTSIQSMTVNTAPETSFAQQLMPEIAMGACVFSFEPYDHVAARPGMQKIFLPMFHEMLRGGMIPDKETVRSCIRAAYQTTDLDADEISMWGYGLYRGLNWSDTPDTYYEKKNCCTEWLPRCGRYFTIPLLPKYMTEKERAMLPGVEIITAERYAELFPDDETKTKWFNRLYPEEFSGDAWGLRMGEWWYFMHPEENKDDMRRFGFTLVRRNVRIEGEIYHHTVGYLHETEDGAKMHLNNLWCNSAGIWNGEYGDYFHFDGAKYQDFVCNHPDYSIKSPTRLRFAGVDDVTVIGDVEYEKKKEGDYLVLTMQQNGPVDLVF